MIYKFAADDNKSVIEVSKEGDNLLIRLDSDVSEILFKKESLYDLIGALHSIQSKIKKEASNV